MLRAPATCEENAFLYISDFPIRIVCSGFDTIEPGGTDYYMNSIGKVGICAECGFLGDEKSFYTALSCVGRLLINLSMIKEWRFSKFSNEDSLETDYMQVKELYYAKKAFSLTKEFSDFEMIKKGRLIGFDGNDGFRMPYDGFILFARNVCERDVDREAFLLGAKINKLNKEKENYEHLE